ncbi:MAG: hypothetical protein K9G33_14295 [Sneathiella sp.]|nr:hypothetical protein [Sneathiella sp.]
MNKLLLVSMAVAALSFTSSVFAAPVETMETSIGAVLAGPNGMTLYTFKKDTENMSNCYDACAKAWPPLLAAEGDEAMPPYSIISRNDGTKQWAVNGKPLYYWVKDQKAGDTTGDGFKDVWTAARP